MTTKNTLKGSVSGPFLFVVNPNSGTGIVQSFGDALASMSDTPHHEVIISESGDHSKELAAHAAQNGYGAVIAVGGDGSVNEIGRQLIGTNTPLGIVPTGSGNGIARHFGISTHLQTAIGQAFQGNVRTIDTISVNEHVAVGFCGVGLDGFIAREFNKTTDKRGFANYVRLTLNIFGSYEPKEYTIQHGDHKETLIATSLVAANAKQFGNNAYINPTGLEDDGIMELIKVSSFPKNAFASLTSRLFLKTIHKSRYVETIPLTRLRISNPQREAFQVDGEFAGNPEQIDIAINPRSLNILVP